MSLNLLAKLENYPSHFAIYVTNLLGKAVSNYPTTTPTITTTFILNKHQAEQHTIFNS